MRINRKWLVLYLILALLLCWFLFRFTLPEFNKIEYTQDIEVNKVVKEKKVALLPASHIETPQQVKAIYISSWVAGSYNYLNPLIELLDNSELNAVVIDVKDSTGKISFKIDELANLKTYENRIANPRNLIEKLHNKNIYVIGRIAVFQDPALIEVYPEIAVKKESDKEAFWEDRKGVSWVDAGSQIAWDYNITLSKEAYKLGFDEINFDYIRFPSDGNMKDIYYPISEGKVKAEVVKSFFEYVSSNIDMPMSVDLFGMTTTNNDDLNIGQVWEYALPHFDYLCPMIYPSHYPSGWNNYSKPATNPYEIIKLALEGAIEKTILAGYSTDKIRPWLQDFDLGAIYTKEMVQEQIQATYDVGLDSWLMWDPANRYTKNAFENNL
ncbi:MAG: putative glycoside hydrolase [Patescibacteria group bacterium]|nr:putative glycoside hydrolase [Patescibacteria group bacterium]